MADDGFGCTVRLSVQNSKKMRSKCVRGILNGEVVLMVAHDGDQHFFG